MRQEPKILYERRIRKKSGGFRTIVVPNKKLKKMLRAYLPKLEALAMTLDVYGVQHGFVPCRSPVTNAAVHVGYRWSICFDLADCFDHVTAGKVKAIVGELYWQLRDYCFYNGVARQGLPTSPVLANIALVPVDLRIVNMLAGSGVYTRYADDLTISTNDPAIVQMVLSKVPQICQDCDFPVNPRKTHVLDAKAGRRIITGVAVDDKGVHPTRAVKRKLRAAQHQHNAKQANGLKEWSKLKKPDVVRFCMERYAKNPQDALAALVLSKGIANYK